MSTIITVHDLFGSESQEVGVFGLDGQVAGSNLASVRNIQ